MGRLPTRKTITSLVSDLSNPRILYASSGDGVFKSTDAGASWQTMNTGLPDTRIASVTIHPTQPSRLYAVAAGGRVLPNGSGFPIFRIRVNRQEKETASLPERLSTIEKYKPEDTVNLRYPRTFHLLMRHMAWTINGRTFRMEKVANDEKVRMDSLEVWEFINEGGGMGMMGMMRNYLVDNRNYEKERFFPRC